MDNQPPVPLQPQGPPPTPEAPQAAPQPAVPLQPVVPPVEPVATPQIPMQPTTDPLQPVASPQGFSGGYQNTGATMSPAKKSNKKLIILAVVIFVLLAGTAAVIFRPKKNSNSSAKSGSISQDTKTATPSVSGKTFKVVRSGDYSDVCSGDGWPSNAQSSPSGKVTVVHLERASRPGAYAEYSFDIVKPEQDVSDDTPTTVDRVACMQIDSKEQSRMECKFSTKSGTMILKDYKVKVYDLKLKSKIAEFTLPPLNKCPTIGIISADNIVSTKVDFAASSKKFSEL